MVADWNDLAHYYLILTKVRVILSICHWKTFCCAFTILLHNNVTCEFQSSIITVTCIVESSNIFRYLPKTSGIAVNRTTTIYPHKETYALGNYRGNPFIVGSHSPDNIKTEIMDQDYQWEEAADYPFSNSNL